MRQMVAVLVMLGAFCGSLRAEELTLERLFDSPALEGETIRGLKVAPDGSRVTFLRGKTSDYERLDLWEYHIKDGETRLLFDSDDLHRGDENLSDEEKARRERLRLSGSGIVSYEWSRDGKQLAFPLAGDVYVWKVGSGTQAEKVVDTQEFETDVQFSPRGRYLSYIREQNLYVLDLTTGQEKALSQDGGGTIKYGMAEFVAQEEMQRMTGYWWSEDDSKIALIRVDESPVAEVERSEIYADEIKTIKQRYPFAGTPNARVSLGIVTVADGATSWVDLGEPTDIYLPRVKWTRDSNLLSYQWQSRDQKRLELRLVRWPGMQQRTVLTETSPTWINLHDDLHFLKDGERFLWASERDGYKHLYLYSLSGKQLAQVTRGAWVVDELEHFDEASGLLWFTGRLDTPLERHLYAVPTRQERAQPRRVSQTAGMHDVTFSKDGSIYVDLFSTASTPPQVSLHDRRGARLTWLLENRVEPGHPLYPYRERWIEPIFSSLTSEDGVELHYRLYRPANFEDGGRHPVLVYLYGGPRAQRVTRSWGSDTAFCQYMAQQGYAVFTLDNRGSTARGKAFEDPIYRAMGEIEVADQVTGVKFLRALPWVDPERIGVHGSSYGGYLSLMTVFKEPDYFRAGAAGAPVTDWRLYDTHYTERYLGHPDSPGEVYEKSSVFPYAAGLKRPMLIYHGMADDNVLFTHSTKLYQYLQDRNIPFTAMDYPGKKHRFAGKTTNMHRVGTIQRFFDLHFGIQRPVRQDR
jgi:dipeptidyl-peptidase-4